MTTEAWETPVADTTIAGLRTLCESLILARESKDVIAQELKTVQEAIDELETKILSIMKENAMPNFKGEFGTISIKNTKSITQPGSLEEKLQLFQYLQGQGIFNEMVNVNSRTLSSWVNKEIEAKEKEGIFGWVPPGLKPPETYASLSVRKK
jgi:hypothetical protein